MQPARRGARFSSAHSRIRRVLDRQGLPHDQPWQRHWRLSRCHAQISRLCRATRSQSMKYSVRAFNVGTFWVPGPEVYWMEAWNQREEMNALIYLVQGGGHNILINTGPPQDLTV